MSLPPLPLTPSSHAYSLALSFFWPSADYPFRAPKVSFATKIYHCNVDASGAICLGTLKEKWAPSVTTSKVLVELLELLKFPNPDDPLDAESALVRAPSSRLISLLEAAE